VNHAVSVAALGAFLQKHQREGIFHLGQSDVSITAPDGHARLLLCHEGDMHFDGEAALAEEVAVHWRANGWAIETD
jgi:hypothetical protein